MEPISNFQVIPNQWGGQLDLTFYLPLVLPDRWKLLVFKRNGETIPDEDIQWYISDIENITKDQLYDKRLFVFPDIDTKLLEPSGQCLIEDYFCNNEEVYFYKIVILDLSTNISSSPIESNGQATPEIEVGIEDSKKAVEAAIKKMFDNVSARSQKVKINFKKDIDFSYSHSRTEITKDRIVLESINGSTAQTYIGDTLRQYSNKIELGEKITEVIRVYYLTVHPHRRELVRRMFQAHLVQLRRHVKNTNNGIDHVSVTVEGDYYNPTYHGEDVVGVLVVFSLLMESKIEAELKFEDIKIGDIKVEQEIK